MSAFLAMGGHGLFIWPAYGLTAIVMAALAVCCARRLARLRRDLDRLRDGKPRDRS